jgi:hypothetical protein
MTQTMYAHNKKFLKIKKKTVEKYFLMHKWFDKLILSLMI